MDLKVKSVLHPYIYDDVKSVLDCNIDLSRFKNKTLLITGGSGFIAFYIVCALLTANDIYGNNTHVIALVRNPDNAEKKYGELTKRDDLEILVQDVCEPILCDKKSDFVIHAASSASAYYFGSDPVGTIDANLSGTLNALRYACDSGSESALIVSSLKVYGELHNGKSKISESDIGYIDINNSKNCYAQGKRTAETIGCCYAEQFGLNVKIARPAYIYGSARIDDDRVWAQLIANAVRKENILLKSSGAALRSFCYVSDAASALLKILLDGKSCKPYNISNPDGDVTIRSFAKAVAEAFPERGLKVCFENPSDEKEPEPSPMAPTPEILDSTALNKLGWKPSVNLIEGIRRSARIVELQLKNRE